MTNYSRDDLTRLVKDSSMKNQQFFVAYLGLLSYVLLAVFSTTDGQLLDPVMNLKLPILGVDLPLLGFYFVAPLVVLSIHFNLLQNLESHHNRLMAWQASYPGNAVPRVEINAFLFDYAHLEHGSKLGWLVRQSSRLLFLYSGPIALYIVLWRFSDYQSPWLSGWHLSLLALDCLIVWKTQSSFNRYEGKASLVLPILFGALVSLQLVIVYPFCCASSEFFVTRIWAAPAGLLAGESLQDLMQAREEKEGDDTKRQLLSLLLPVITLDRERCPGGELNLKDRSLRGFAAPNCKLELVLDMESRLEGVDLSKGRLSGHLERASFQGANLQNAQLPGAGLYASNLRYAQLQFATLTHARLQEADLQGADLSYAQLGDASLNQASLQGALLIGAQLQHANLQEAHLQGASLWLAHLQDAYLSDAQLEGANLSGAEWQSAHLMDSQLGGAIISRELLLSEPAALLGKPQPVAYADPLPPSASDRVAAHLQDVPEALWSQIIPQWEHAQWDESEAINQARLNIAGRGVWQNYLAAFGKTHPEYLHKLNEAFCRSQKLTSLCHPVSALPPLSPTKLTDGAEPRVQVATR